jgi:hypothetical protein
VIGHVGLTPQAVNALGGYGARGKDKAEQEKILGDAYAIAQAGCFALVIEGVMEPLAQMITRAVKCPTIGIGASVACDGQVLVTEDMLGMFERTPRFVKRYDDLAARISGAAETYAGEVRSRAFPTEDQIYRPSKSFLPGASALDRAEQGARARQSPVHLRFRLSTAKLWARVRPISIFGVFFWRSSRRATRPFTARSTRSFERSSSALSGSDTAWLLSSPHCCSWQGWPVSCGGSNSARHRPVRAARR